MNAVLMLGQAGLTALGFWFGSTFLSGRFLDPDDPETPHKIRLAKDRATICFVLAALFGLAIQLF